MYAETFKGRTPPAPEDYKSFTKTKAKQELAKVTIKLTDA
jgi:hypothetical protein